MIILHAIATFCIGAAGFAALFITITQIHTARWTIVDALLGQHIPAPRHFEESDHG